ncbi:hypothetical protein [Dactylosporangium sp. CS-033363]|uniref:hypothetical protein n=1 Tax=Dactylosporangium sp. CS-033363 TaxID=3239935 RepID=UPI003D944CF3
MTPTDRVLNASLYFAPVLYLLADVLYALNGWSDPTAGAVHVLAATAYGFLLVRALAWTGGVTGAVLLVVGMLGLAGNVGYGFNTIHVSLGDTDLVDATGAATIIKPLGLFFPLTLLIIAWVLRRQPVAAALVGVAGLAWPVAHIANIAWLAVLVNVLLVAGFALCAMRGVSRAAAPDPATASPSPRTP